MDDMAERLAKVETEVTNLKDRNSTEHGEFKVLLMDYMKKSDARFERMWEQAGNKFAGKMVEKIVYGMVGVVMLTMLGSFLSLIMK